MERGCGGEGGGWDSGVKMGIALRLHLALKSAKTEK